MDVGSGYGGLITSLRKFGGLDFNEPYNPAREYLYDFEVDRVYQHDSFPNFYQKKKKYDVVTSFDVLEHIDDDDQALQIIHDTLLKRYGFCFITVPAHEWLWTWLDDKSGHHRRYTKKTLTKKIKDAGFTNISISYFYLLLIPMSLGSFAYGKISKQDYHYLYEFKINSSTVNHLLERIFSFEENMIRKGTIPFGFNLVAKMNR